MKFSSMLLYINDRFPTLSDFQKLLQIGSSRYWKGSYLNDIEQELVADRFYWMYFQYENANLYSDRVIDITDDTVIVEFGNNKNCRIPMQKSAIVESEKPDAE